MQAMEIKVQELFNPNDTKKQVNFSLAGRLIY
jgi:hypothetical protein